ncbi:MAG: cysteine desulfurase-like protein [Myxococcota bacterium]|nr:cysteine desulfurase-like protein [Myxococcota bacterium]
MSVSLDLKALRSAFPGLARQIGGQQAVFFDGPAGSQVPQRVADAVSHYLLHTNANGGGSFETSVLSDALVDEARRSLGALLGAPNPLEELVFGPNMTTLTFGFSRALAQQLGPGDELLLSRMEHDANVTPWLRAAEDSGATVRFVDLRPGDATLDLDDLEAKLSERTRLVAVGYASNALGTINPIARIAAMAHSVGAWLWVDAVHYAPHGRIDVESLGCDFLVVSTYKFFGPHLGLLWGRSELLSSLSPYKVRPSPSTGPDRWMTGTPSLEGIAGAREAVHYLADLAGPGGEQPEELARRLDASYAAIQEHEQVLGLRLVEGLGALSDYRVWGIADPKRFAERVPTFSITHPDWTPAELARALAAEGIFTWSGNHYAQPLTEALDLEPGGTLRVGFLHYNTASEVDRLLVALERLGQRTGGG